MATVETIETVVGGVDIIDVDAILGDEETSGLVGATGGDVTSEVSVDGEGGCGGSDGAKNKLDKKSAAEVLMSMMETPLK